MVRLPGFGSGVSVLLLLGVVASSVDSVPLREGLSLP